MPDNRNHKSSAMSLPGILAFLCGAFFLFAYWKFPAVTRQQNGFVQIMFIGASAVMALWGMFQVWQSPVAQGSDASGHRMVPREPNASVASRSQNISWLGIVLVLIGSQLIYAVTTRSNNRLYVVSAWVAGGFFALGGVYEILRACMPASHKGRARNRQALSKQGGVYLAMMCVMFVGSLIGRSNMLMLVFALMAGPFVAGGWMTFTMLKRMRVRRSVPRRMMAGDRVWIDLTLENNKRKVSSWLMDVADEIRGNGEALTSGVLFARVGPRKSRTGRYQLRLMQRGRYTFGPLTVTTRFPLGFVERGLEFTVADETLVYPRLGELTQAWKNERPTDTELVQSQQPQKNIYDDEFHRLREFRWGDNPRAIHWRTSARRNELMMREYQQTRQQDLTILLDLWIPEKPNDGDWERVELAVSFAATIGVDQMRDSRDSRIRLGSAGQSETRWEGQAGPSSFDSFLEVLAVVQPGVTPNTKWLAENILAGTSQSSRILLISSRQTDSELMTAIADAYESIGASGSSQAAACETIFTGSPDLARYFQIRE